MQKKIRICLFLFPISLILFYLASSNIVRFISPMPLYATNWNVYNRYFYLGGENLDDGNYQKALDFYDKAIEIYKRDGALYYNRALAKYELGDFKGAIEDYKEALKYEDKMRAAVTHLNLGNAYKEIEKFEKALIHFNKAISIKPNEVLYYRNRGSLFFNQEKWDEALKDYETAKVKYLKKKENIDEYFHNDIGFIHFNLGSFQLAIDNYEKAIEENSKVGMFYADKGDALLEIGKEDMACKNYLKSFELGYEEIQNYLESKDGEWCK